MKRAREDGSAKLSTWNARDENYESVMLADAESKRAKRMTPAELQDDDVEHHAATSASSALAAQRQRDEDELEREAYEEHELRLRLQKLFERAYEEWENERYDRLAFSRYDGTSYGSDDGSYDSDVPAM